MMTQSPTIPKDLKTRLPVIKPTWGLSESGSLVAETREKIKATWLGHACFLVELPVRSPDVGRGARILFDPVFSDRCSPSQIIGPKRFTEPPCKISEIPEIDAIVISHNHYDHLDTHTITELMKRKRPPQIFAPLGNGPYFHSLGIKDELVHTLDWWEGRRVEINVKTELNDVQVKADAESAPTSSAKLAFDVTCTPAQHFTGRGLHDRFRTLWASWAIQEAVPAESASTTKGVQVYFAGDTGYRAVRDGQDQDAVPTCPAFKEIGERFGGFDFAMIPIGAYQPRDFMSPIHCSPHDSVAVFKDVRAKKALGMHWGTWVLTTEDVLEPPVLLAEERKKAGIADDDFVICDIGETRIY